MPPLPLRAAQTTSPAPSAAQLGFDVTTPATIVQPLQLLPLKRFTISVCPRPRAAQTATPVDGDAQDGSDKTTVVPMDIRASHLAQADGTAQSMTAMTQKSTMRFVLMVGLR